MYLTERPQLQSAIASLQGSAYLPTIAVAVPTDLDQAALHCCLKCPPVFIMHNGLMEGLTAAHMCSQRASRMQHSGISSLGNTSTYLMQTSSFGCTGALHMLCWTDSRAIAGLLKQEHVSFSWQRCRRLGRSQHSSKRLSAPTLVAAIL